MLTLILPGGSIKNKTWAEEMAQEMNLPETIIQNWETWKTAEPRSLDFQIESNKLLQTTGSETINILAKSIGTIVFSRNIKKLSDRINKVILCGLPLDGEGFTHEDFSYYDDLKLLPANNILIFQNSNDPLGPFSKVSEYIKAINPQIQIIEKDRSDHHYPYPQDFKNFFAG